MKKFMFILLLFNTLFSLAQTPKQEKVIDEFVQRYNRGNDDIVQLYYNLDRNDYNNACKKVGEEIRSLRSSLGEISNVKLMQKKGNTIRYEVKLSNAGLAEMKIAFKNDLIDNFSFKTSEEYKVRSHTDGLIAQSFDSLRSAYMAFDTDRSFEEIEKIEKLYESGKSSKNNDFKHRIKYLKAEVYAASNNNDEALRLLSELKEAKPEYAEASVYGCSFAALHSSPEYIKLVYDPLTQYFVLTKSLEDSLRQYIDTSKPDDMLRCLDVKDSLYTALAPDHRAKVSYVRVNDILLRAAAYSMKGNIGNAVNLLKGLNETSKDYAINNTVDNDLFKNMKQDKEYQKLISGMTCNCGDVFDWAVTAIEKSDAGFDYAIEMKGKEAYEKHTAEKRIESKSITSSHDCVKVVDEWLKFFRKSHIGFYMNMPAFADTVNTYDKFAIKRLSAKTMYIKLKSFNGNRSRQEIARMVQHNDYLISNTPNLIIDLRGNGGGSDDAWMPLCKYFNSKPIYFAGGNLTRVSEENALYFERYGAKDRADYIRNNADKRFAGNSGLIVNRPDRVQKYPENIVILTDNSTGSSAESLLMQARQSRKVKVMGQKSYGAEEVGNCLLAESPDKQFLLFYGTTIRTPAKYTQYLDYGLQPDIFLTADLDWIDIAKEYLEY